MGRLATGGRCASAFRAGALAIAALAIPNPGCTFVGLGGGGEPGSDAGDGNMGLDAGPDGGGIEAICGTPGAFIDDFSDGRRWFQVGDADIATFDGDRVTLTLAEGTSSGVMTAFAVDARDAVMTIEVAAPLSSGQTAAGMFILDTRDHFAGFGFGGNGSMSVQTVLGSGALETTSIPGFDAATDLFFRFAGSGTTLTFSTSTDRASWTEVHTVTDPAVETLLSAAFVQLTAIALDASGAGATIAFDDLNTTEAEPAPWCKAHRLTDDFADNSLSARWFPVRFPACTGGPEEAGAANLGQDANLLGRTVCSITTSAAVDLRASEVVFRRPSQVVAPAEWSAFFRVEAAAGGFVTLSQQNGRLCTFARDELGVVLSGLQNCIPDISAAEYWRVSMSSTGLITFEVSANAVTWTPILVNGPAPFRGEEVDVAFGTASSGLPSPVAFGIEGVNE